MENVVKNQEGKELQTAGINTPATDEELAQLIEQSASLQQQENKDDPIQADYICLAKPGTKALKKSEKELHIPGLSIGDFFIQKDKIILGDQLKVVPLAFITVYNEKTGSDRNAKFCGVWNQEQSKEYPLVEGSYFDRQLPNGHILTPTHWVMVEILGHKEIQNAVITYKSTGSRIYKAWKEDAKSRAKSSATLVYTICEGSYNNDKFDWTDISFAFSESLLEKDKAECYYCVKKSNALREAYNNAVLVPNRTVEKITEKPVAALPETAAYEETDTYDDEENGF